MPHGGGSGASWSVWAAGWIRPGSQYDHPILVGSLRLPGDLLAAMCNQKVDAGRKLVSVQSTNRVQETLSGIDITDGWQWIVNAGWPVFFFKSGQKTLLVDR